MISLSDKNSEDLREMKELWNDCFHDSEGFTDYYFHQVIRKNQIVVMKEAGQIVGMIHLNPYTFSPDGEHLIRVAYVVGVAVWEEYRRQGRMGRMMEYAMAQLEEQHVQAAYLWPADERYYRNMGFVPVTRMEKVVFTPEELKKLVQSVNSTVDETFHSRMKDLILPVYSGDEEFTGELSSEQGIYQTLREGKVRIGSFSALWNEEHSVLSVEHFLPDHSIRELLTGLLIQVRQEKYLPEKIEITMDSRLMDCIRAEVNPDKISLSYRYMVRRLQKPGSLFPAGAEYQFLFTEVV